MKFIATATGAKTSKVGHTLGVKTTRIVPIECNHPELGHLWLLDTPGLDETTGYSDMKVHTKLNKWLRKKLRQIVGASLLY